MIQCLRKELLKNNKLSRLNPDLQLEKDNKLTIFYSE